mgnify:CR=1 FL=1
MKDISTPTPPRKTDTTIKLDIHVKPKTLGDKIAYGFVKMLRFSADLFFGKRYGHRAIVLETVAAIPGMVGGMWQHLHALRKMKHDKGWVRTLLEEAENERMHLMTFIEIYKPTFLERVLIRIVQAIFFVFYFFLYLFSSRTAHRVVGYFEEEAIISYTQYLEEIDSGNHKNVPAPQVAINYWGLKKNATLRDVIVIIRADEAEHRDVNHKFVEAIDNK